MLLTPMLVFHSTTTAPLPTKPELNLRQYQVDAISETYHHFESGKTSVLLYAPTGAGKTIIASKIIADYVQEGKRVMFLVHRGKLIRQTCDKLSKFFNIDSSIIWSNYYTPDFSKPVQIAMLQTIRNRELPEDIDLVILDEAHTGSYYSIWRQIMDKYSLGIWALSKTHFLGLSASPWRAKNDEGYCQYFQTIVKAPYPQQLIEIGHLCRARQFAFTNLIDESKLKTVNGEYTEKSMADVCTPALDTEIIKLYLEKDPNVERKLIAFCATVMQAYDLAYQFNAKGVPAECIIAETPEAEREEIFDKFSKGEIKLISSVGVLTEGFDEPSVTSILVCRPVKSKALWVQMNGRGLRPLDDKNDCWFLDFCGNIKRLGMPTDSFPLDNLCPTYKPHCPIPTKTCPNCNSEIPRYEKICPVCGYIFGPRLDIILPEKRPFEEVLTDEQKKHVRFLKVRAVNAYNKRKKLDDLDTQFVNEFGYDAPSDWFDGLIWGHNFNTWSVNVQHYWRYLLTVTPNPGSKVAREEIEKLIRQEFKSAIKHTEKHLTHSFIEASKEINASDSTHNECDSESKESIELYDGITQEDIELRVAESIQKLIEYKPWWVILKSSSIPDALDINTLYVQRRGEYLSTYPGKPELLIPHMELLAVAVGEAIEYYAQEQKTIDTHIHRIKQSISVGAFLFVKEYSARLELSIKQRVWSSLTPQEKQAYRRWQNEHPMDTLPQHKIKAPTEPINTPHKPTTKNTQYINQSISTSTQHISTGTSTHNTNTTHNTNQSIQNSTNGNNTTTTTERTNTNNHSNTNSRSNTNISNKIKHDVQPYKAVAQLSLFTLPEDEKTKAANDICNPLRLTVGDLVASNNPNNPAYNWCGQIMKNHPSDPRLCYVSYPERQKVLNLKHNETWCRFVDLRRV